MQTKIILSLIGATFLAGCGSSSNNLNQAIEQTPTTIPQVVPQPSDNTTDILDKTLEEPLLEEPIKVLPSQQPTQPVVNTDPIEESPKVLPSQQPTQPVVDTDPIEEVTASQPVDITVERGPVIGAYVSDAKGVRGYNLGNGNYRFNEMPSYPIHVYGGYIDVNRDGIINDNDSKLMINLSLHERNQTKVTLVTTLAHNNELKDELMGEYGLSQEDIYTLTPSQSLEVASISDELYRYCIENNTTLDTIDLNTLVGLREKIQSRLQSSQDMEGDIIDIITQNEIALMKELDNTLKSNETKEAQNDINNSSAIQAPQEIVDALPITSLSQDQIDGLLFMYQEEKVARDLYLKLYETWGLNIFSNIAASEQTHMDAVKTLLQKYEIAVPVEDESYGEFALEELQSLYDALILQGSTSSTDALEVGKLVEETDIADLQERLVDAPEDIAIIYNSLLEGSYNHLNAFNSQLEGNVGGGNGGNGRR